MTTIPETCINFTEIDGIRVRQMTFGESSSPPVLMLHGWGASIDLLWQLGQPLAQQGYYVIAPDMPGFGETPPPPTAWTVFDYANFILKFTDSHRLTQFHLFGHSFGGRLALILGADHTERVKSMVLADSAGIRPKLPLAIRTRTSVYKSIRDGLNAVGLRGLSNTLRESYNQRYGSSDFQQSDGVMRQTFINVINQDLLDHAARVSVPTLLIWGENDTDTPLWMGEKLEQTIPDAALVTYPNAGHYSYLENIPQTVRVMNALFKNE